MRIVRFTHDVGTYDADLAADAQRVLDEWSAVHGPIAILVEALGPADLGPEWRASWLSWFGAERRTIPVAVLGAHHLDAAKLSVFAFASGVDLRAFEHEPAAVAWLQESF